MEMSTYCFSVRRHTVSDAIADNEAAWSSCGLSSFRGSHDGPGASAAPTRSSDGGPRNAVLVVDPARGPCITRPAGWPNDANADLPDSSERRGSRQANGFPIVAQVRSAGGIDALTQVLTPLPGDLPATVIVLQHISPHHPSALAELLNQRTTLAVAAATDGAPLAPGTARVTPPGQHTSSPVTRPSP
jgi:chemotaxis response regulator CheB